MYMLLILGVVGSLTAAVVMGRVRVPGGVHPDKLGWMSERWLAEYRASRSR